MSNAEILKEGWLPASWNGGHAYADRANAAAPSVVGFYAERYTHSDRQVWRERLAAGEIWRNGQQLLADGPLSAGDRLVWHRPPWQEPAVPVLHEGSIVFDDGDLLVLNKPSGLPVLPAGGFLKHTLLTQLEGWASMGVISSAGGLPRPVHRLGRFTSGLLVCARRAESRAWLSAQLRESTSAAVDVVSPPPCRKLYRALCQELPPDWAIGERRVVYAGIGKRSHPLLGLIWCAAGPGDRFALQSRSEIKLLERRQKACLVDVAIATGRPHQIRIHTAIIGAPLVGDALYLSGGDLDVNVLPGDGGYWLHAYHLHFRSCNGEPIDLEASLPLVLNLQGQ
ncbi:RluA family pseudouridine synthase [Vulcanococcus sp. Clear-D1]|uniref:pseudouridine synthase n=1 Tax=Vulcanococcus sp. Clear-D1 TaxID=2766970 RepID=UPI0019C01153|nr:RluA family pseudouridine synthase [Vulcanococcus sp. Clear-D1]MBD1195544.1 RluA family pseudouridine synthase [Vulcanococcus sp. Clear-D1]